MFVFFAIQTDVFNGLHSDSSFLQSYALKYRGTLFKNSTFGINLERR